MREQNQDAGTAQDSLDDLFEPIIGDISDDSLAEFSPLAGDKQSSEKQKLVEKRRLAEKRLEEKRLRDELGDYDLELDDC